MEEPEKAAQLVVIGASAGGIEALSTLLSALPVDFPSPIVVAQHLDPTRVSHLQEILGRAGPLPVRSVTEQVPLQAGVVYVVPANRNVEITNHHVGLTNQAGGRSKPSIDLLLGTAAEVFGENLYAVILSGTGSDGADGARRVKENGGTVVIQNPRTASFPGMPLSLAPTLVDIVADLEAIGPLLHELLTGAYSPPSPDEDRRMRALLEQLRGRSGIDFGQYREPTIRRRLQRRMVETGRETLEAYTRYLQRHPEEYDRLLSSFLIKVTDFFRDDDLFTYLREQTLPELIGEARGHEGELRIWSAGCATGEEAYSLAILVAELLGDELEDFKVRLYTTDVDAQAVAFARRGVYPASAVEHLPPETVSRYFKSQDGAYEIKKFVRRLVVFARHDLAQRAPFPRIDLILCRNVLIYFTPELQRRVLQLFAFSLRSGGRLMLGKSETAGPLSEFFALENARLKVYRRQGKRVPFPTDDILGAVPGRMLADPRPEPASFAMPLAYFQQERHLSPVSGEPADRLLLDLPLGVVLVDRHYDIQAINPAARRLLSIHTPAIGEDLIHAARRAPADRLRACIDRALRGQEAAERLEVETVEATPIGPRTVEIRCIPQRTGRSDGIARVLVVIADVTPSEPERSGADPGTEPQQARLRGVAERVRALAEQSVAPTEQQQLLGEVRAALAAELAELERLTKQARQLEAARNELLEANQDLASANSQLRNEVDELAVANEEAQAAIEEVETLSEEQQASNEEFETVNEELQATIEELNTANDDLESRGRELEVTAERLEGERSRLAAILTSMADGVLVVDRDGRPLVTNPAFERMFGPAGADFVPEDEQGKPLPPTARPQRRAAAGETFGLQFTATAADGTRRWFEASGRPIQGDAHQGGVVLIRDITERSLLRLQNDFLAMASHELNTPLTAISGSLQMLIRLEQAGRDAPRRRHYADLALNQVRRLAELVRDLSDVVRLQTGNFRLEPRPIDLAALTAETVELAQAQTDGQTIRFQAEPQTLLVNGDPDRIQQVLLNLLTNAERYARGSEYIDVGLRREDNAAQLEVRDYGPGIPPSDLDRIFSRFYQVNGGDRRGRGGLGLGLFIAREIVRAHEGSIEVRSREGEGTTFAIRLSLATSAASAS